ncbi:MAG: hypothetical protein EHM60_12970 [Lysobacterales bacterium]|nr:MAG: hypothetical protein EHM60_12970 [Xanthomonadales bacterium]
MKIRYLILSAWLACGTVAATAPAHATGRWVGPASLEGAWRVAIRPYVCATGVDVPNAPPVVSYLLFGRGGTLVETTSNPAFDPGQRSPGLGTWERTGRSTYRSVIRAWIQFDSAGGRYKRGRQVIDQGIEFNEEGTAWTSNASVTFYDAAGEIALAGCARATAERLD